MCIYVRPSSPLSNNQAYTYTHRRTHTYTQTVRYPSDKYWLCCKLLPQIEWINNSLKWMCFVSENRVNTCIIIDLMLVFSHCLHAKWINKLESNAKRDRIITHGISGWLLLLSTCMQCQHDILYVVYTTISKTSSHLHLEHFGCHHSSTTHSNEHIPSKMGYVKP